MKWHKKILFFPSPSRSKSVKGHWGLARLQIQLWVVGCSEGLRHRCEGHLSGISRLSGECGSYRATCCMLWIHEFLYSPGEALAGPQVSGLNDDILHVWWILRGRTCLSRSAVRSHFYCYSQERLRSQEQRKARWRNVKLLYTEWNSF